ncbi:isopentenyl-diphosphate Delta-isomerase [Candidatus Woesearchaeota archaeon]|nr:isopentenyl-diphosphate Delta-isomerase [Candidatus Woesearchaeota archaeon]
MNRVILVDEHDNEIGSEEKLAAHKKAELHRAFSVCVFNSKKELLIQQRSESKYHSPGLWSNTCCSHPQPGEEVIEAAHRRLKQEFGFDCGLKELFTFIYKKDFNNGLFEHELDHVLTGKSDGVPEPNPDEIMEWKWINPEELKKDMIKNPDKYTYWFRFLLDNYFDELIKK